MSREQFVLLGAGASHGCCTLPEKLLDMTRQPPVVAELFDERYSWARNNYPLVREVAAMSAPVLARGAIAFEDYLREEYRDSPRVHERERYWSVPLYLQELMVSCSATYTQYPDALLRLVATARRNEHVNFVSLNYDTILDQILEGAGVSLSELGAFVDNRENWTLVKPHGSADWARRVLTADGSNPETGFGYGALCSQLGRGAATLDDEILPLGNRDRGNATTLRNRDEGFCYPALSAPLGPDDELTCPPEHIEALVARMRAQEDLSLVIVGYSCYDRKVLELIKQSERMITSVVIVCGSEEAGQAALTNLQAAIPIQAPRTDRTGEPDSIVIFPGDLAEFTQSEGFEASVVLAD